VGYQDATLIILCYIADLSLWVDHKMGHYTRIEYILLTNIYRTNPNIYI